MSTKIKQELLETGETLHCCPQCPFKADKLQTTKVHMLRHSGQFSCQKCKKSCRSEKDLRSHMKNIHKEQSVDEKIVPEQHIDVKKEENEVTVLKDKSRLGRRQKKESSSNKYRCQYCEYTTDRQILLNQHCKYHMNSSVIKHLCPACFKPFPSPYHVKRHIHYNHPDTTYSLIKLEPKKGENNLKSEIITTQRKDTKRKGFLSTKKRSHRGASKVVQYTRESSLKQRETITKEELHSIPEKSTFTDSYQCAHCKYSTNQKNHLRQHMTYHSSKYLCEICDKSFPCAKRLQLHVERIHVDMQLKSTETSDHTETCAKSEPITSLWGFDLSDFGIDAIVLNDETEESPFTTNQTTNTLPTYSSSIFPNEFNVQTESPTDVENPFSCPFCSYRGKKKRNLDSHMVYHTDKFKCTTCSKRHPTLYHLNRHIRLVHCGNSKEIYLKQEQDPNDQQSSPSLYFPADTSEIKEESECSLPFNLTDLMDVEATEDLNGTIKLEPDSDYENPETQEYNSQNSFASIKNERLNSLNDEQKSPPNDIQFSVREDGQKLFFCSDCPYQNAKKQNVKQHRKIHTPQYACHNCGKGHTTSYHLKRHLSHGSCNNSTKINATNVSKKRVKKTLD